MSKKLIVVAGPTAIGKTDYSIQLANRYGTEIISCDSRQFYTEMKIGTAPPSDLQLATVKHHFIQNRSIQDNYTAGRFEIDALEVLDELFKIHDQVIMVGGSGLYIDALCKGIDNIPATDSQLRSQIQTQFEERGLEALRYQLRKLDPDVCNIIDLQNPQRVMRALEVCITTGTSYSSLRKNFEKKRNFTIETLVLQMDRSVLYQRINDRVDLMLEAGLEQEAKKLYPLRHCNALKTVGYREWFAYFDGEITKDKAIELIKQNTRHYAKRQISWFKRDTQSIPIIL